MSFLASLVLCALGVTVELTPEAHVSGAELTLGSIAQVHGDDPAEVATVRAVRLGYAPAPGYSRLLQTSRVARELSNQAPQVQVQFLGASACRVWPELEVVRGSAIEAAARKELQRLTGTTDATFELVVPATDLQVPSGTQPAALSAKIESGALKPGQMSVPVQISIDGNPWRSIWSTWKVTMWDTRPVLARDAAAGTLISADMLVLRRLPVASAMGLSPDKLVGATFARAMKEGDAVLPADVVRAVLVQPGATLILEVRNGAVTARKPVTAEQAGARGDRIRVRFMDSDRTIQAVVLGRDRVVIDLGQGS